MCRLNTEGTQHGCGHYIITKKVSQLDCESPYCIWSWRHAPNCPHCPECTRYYEPDASETITLRTAEYCRECKYWYQGHGARHRNS